MKLHLKDRDKTVLDGTVRVTGKKYLWSSLNNGYDHFICLADGRELAYPSSQSQEKDFRKLKNKNLYRASNNPNWGEQEMTQPVYLHGQTVYSILDLNGGKTVVWDEVKQDCVTPDELTNVALSTNNKAIAAIMGTSAHQLGKPCVPSADLNFMEFVDKFPVAAQRIELMRLWIYHWTAANLSLSPAPHPTTNDT